MYLRTTLASLVIASFALAACQADQKNVTNQSNQGIMKLENAKDKISYMEGYNIGQGLARSQVELNHEALALGLKEGATGVNMRFTTDEAKAIFEEFNAQIQAEAKQKAEAAKAAGEKFLADNAKKDAVVTTESGLQYEVITALEDKTLAHPTATDTVKVHYHGTLTDGSVFDSSVERNEPISFPLNGVIKGWTEGVQLMRVGEKYKFYIPSDLAYGDRTTGKIPGHSTLIFEVELLGIEAKNESKE